MCIWNILTLYVDQDRYASASKFGTLKSALNRVPVLLRSHSSALLSAKLLVLCRVLHKSLAVRSDTQNALDSLAQRLGNLRQRLLRRLDSRLTQRGVDVKNVVEDLTAFCLVTSSSPTDALKRFYGLRARAIQEPMKDDGYQVKNCIKARLELFIDTIRQSKSIFPDLLASSLRTLGSRPVLDDAKIQQLEELKLDVHQRWFTDDVLNYTPWTRHDELQRSKADELLKSWTAGALDALARSIESDLQTDDDIESIVSTRQDIIQMWLSTRSVTRGLNAGNALSRLRAAFTRRCASLTDLAASDLHQCIKSSTITPVNERNKSDAPLSNQNLWNIPSGSELLSRGGMHFREIIMQHRTGKDNAISSVITSFERCAQKIETIHATFKSMSDTRWDDDFDDSDSDTDDEDGGTGVHDLLSRQDPDVLLKQMRDRIMTAVGSLEPLFEEHCTSTDLRLNIFLLRAIRELRQKLSQLLAALEASPAHQLFAQKAVDELHLQLANQLVERVKGTHETALARLHEPMPFEALWEGNPPLPLQARPDTFRYLRKVVQEMERVGPDLWNPWAVVAAKRGLAEEWIRTVTRHYEQMVQEQAIEAAGEDENLQTDRVNGGNAPTDGGEKEEKTTDKFDGPCTDRDVDKDKQRDHGVGEGDAADSRSNDTQSSDHVSAEHGSESKNASDPSHIPTQNLVQLHFDALYLQHALMPAQASTSYTQTQAEQTFAPLLTKLAERIDPEIADAARLEKDAREYWRRTYLLFGLLCNG